MTLPTKIVVIGAGSTQFGENTLSALLRSKLLRGSTIALVDRNRASLDVVMRLAERLNREWDAQIRLSSHLHHAEALDGAAFVVSAIEVGAREELWRTDYSIPLKYGVRQPYAENGGPGGFAHAARNIGPVMDIVHDMEHLCPQAWFVNFTNPMIRICDAVNRHSAIKAVGLCHQIYAGYSMVGVALAKDYGIEVPPELTGMHAAIDQHAAHERVKKQIVPLIDIRAAGLNHFTWILSIRDRRTGEDLYPLFRKRFFELNRRIIFGESPEVLSSNYRMTEFQAAVAVPQLAKVPGYLVEYRKSKEILEEAIAGCDWLDTRAVLPGTVVAPYFWSCIFHGERKGIVYNTFKAALRQAGAPFGTGFLQVPAYLYDLFHIYSGKTEWEAGLCPVAEDIIPRIVHTNNMIWGDRAQKAAAALKVAIKLAEGGDVQPLIYTERDMKILNLVKQTGPMEPIEVIQQFDKNGWEHLDEHSMFMIMEDLRDRTPYKLSHAGPRSFVYHDLSH